MAIVIAMAVLKRETFGYRSEKESPFKWQVLDCNTNRQNLIRRVHTEARPRASVFRPSAERTWGVQSGRGAALY